MAMMVLLLDRASDEFCLRQELVSALARLGVTNVALARDDETIGIVLEGWLFDPARSAGAVVAAVVAAVGAVPTAARTLQPVLHMAVSSAASGSGDGEE